MSVVDNNEAREVPWRPGYRSFILAGKDHGIATSASMGLIEPGKGAPLHFHQEVDEIILVLEGTLDFRLGDERMLVGPNHTISIPARVPHGFVVVSAEPARIVGFMPKQGAFLAATYLEGDPPAGGAQK
jgi:mannose-6-phosphate isomerase-like protein (cupin superfamily)